MSDSQVVRDIQFIPGLFSLRDISDMEAICMDHSSPTPNGEIEDKLFSPREALSFLSKGGDNDPEEVMLAYVNRNFDPDDPELKESYFLLRVVQDAISGKIYEGMGEIERDRRIKGLKEAENMLDVVSATNFDPRIAALTDQIYFRLINTYLIEAERYIVPGLTFDAKTCLEDAASIYPYKFNNAEGYQEEVKGRIQTVVNLMEKISGELKGNGKPPDTMLLDDYGRLKTFLVENFKNDLALSVYLN